MAPQRGALRQGCGSQQILILFSCDPEASVEALISDTGKAHYDL